MPHPIKYKDEYCNDIIEFFKSRLDELYEIAENPKKRKPIFPTMQDYCKKINCHHSSLSDWRSRYPEFGVAYDTAKQYQEDYWVKGSMMGIFDTIFTIFVGKNVFGWRDKQDIDLNLATVERRKIDFTGDQNDG